MNIAKQAPTMPQDTPAAPYRLSGRPDRRKPARDGLERLARVLDKPAWTQADRDRIVRAEDGLWYHWTKAVEALPKWERHECPADCPECAMIGRIVEIKPAIREWDRIAASPPIPSSAWFRRNAGYQSREHKAVSIFRRLRDRQSDRKTTVLATVKKFKTAAVRHRHEEAALLADRRYLAIGRAVARLERIAHKAPWMDPMGLAWISQGKRYPK
jgi:hypothetical protein